MTTKKPLQKARTYVLAIVVVLTTSAFSQPSDLQVSIDDPSTNGFQVRKVYPVKGTIKNLPDGHFLWVLIHRIDFDGVWYPQYYDTDLSDTTWKVMCTFGTQEDIGWDFEIAVAIVNNAEHIKLKDYRKKAMATGEWSPIEIPSTLVPPIIRKVEKIGH